MQLFGCYILHKEREHLAPHRVLASRTGLGTEEGEIIKGPGWMEQNTSTLSSHSGAWVPLGAHCTSAKRPDPHTLQLAGSRRVGKPDSKARRALPGSFTRAENHFSIGAHWRVGVVTGFLLLDWETGGSGNDTGLELA